MAWRRKLEDSECLEKKHRRQSREKKVRRQGMKKKVRRHGMEKNGKTQYRSS
jgi:hypothetical protein